MSNDYYTHTNFPPPNAPGSSAQMRSELNRIELGFSKLPTLTGNGGKLVVVNALGLGLEAVTSATGISFTGGTFTNIVINNATISGGTLSGATVNNSPIGATTPSTGAFTSLTASGGALSGVTVNNSPIGATTPSTGAFTSLTASSGTLSGVTLQNTTFSGTASGTLDGVTVVNGVLSNCQASLTGTPTAPTAVLGTNTTQIATTAFVAQQAFSTALPGQSGNDGKALLTDGANAFWGYVSNDLPLLSFGLI